jgi:hypothetical protein
MLIAKYPMLKPIKTGRCPDYNSIIYQKEYTNPQIKTTGYYFAKAGV